MAYGETFNEDDEFDGRAVESGEETAYVAPSIVQSQEGDVISIAEIIILVLIAAPADAFEIAAAFTACVDFCATYTFSLLIGALASTIIFLWSFLRSVHGGFVTSLALKKVATIALGGALDLITGGALPLRTLTLLLVIWMHNRGAKKDADRLTAAMRRIIEIASKL